MKKTYLFLFIIIAAGLISSSCKSDDDGGGGGSAANGTITAKVNGSSVTTMKEVTFAYNVSGTLTIQGNTGGTSSKAFSLLINGIDGTGTYPIGGGANIANSASYMEIEVDMSNPQNSITHTWQAPYDSNQVGEINISELTQTNVKGTFSYTAKNVLGDGSTKTITEGSFNVNIQ